MWWLLLACSGEDDGAKFGGSSCDTASCDGCCNAEGRCVGGVSDEACGARGADCVDCAAVSQACDTGALCRTEDRTDIGQVDDRALHVLDADDAARLRDQVLAFVWADGALPEDRLPDEISEDVAPPFETSAARVDALTVDLGGGYVSVITALHPAAPSGALAIVHQGHTDEMSDAGVYESTELMLSRGAIVLLHAMPLYADYDGPAGSHDELILAGEPGPDHPLHLFLEPVAAGINHAIDAWGVDEIAMLGISGGGWTTTIYAAIDPRVRLSFPVAGSLPVYLRDSTDLGDMEQYLPQLYSLVGFPDLYVLSGWGEGRAALQILNRYDACCFAGTRYQAYADEVRDATAALGGRWDLFLDESHANHEISSFVLDGVISHALNEDGVRWLDDLSPAWGGFALEGDWTEQRGAGWNGDQQAGEGSARWTLDVEDGEYRVYATWSPDGAAGEARFTVQGADSVTITVDQRETPDDLNDAGAGWALLGTVRPAEGEITVSLETSGPGLADAVRLAPVAR